MAEISSSRIVITVLGKNRPGIVAGVTRVLGEANVDIRDITQSIIEDIFTMTMLADTAESKLDFAELQKALAGGSGITPFYAMAKEIAHGKMHGCRLTILYGSVKSDDIVLKDELDQICAECPDVKVVHVLSDDPDWPGEHGFITREIIEKYAAPNSTFLFCGPLAMFRFVRKALEDMGVPQRRFRHDVVNNPADISTLPGYPKGTEEKTFRITVVRGIHEDVIDARASESVAVALERSAIPVDTHCRNGECGFCRSQLLGGDIFVSPIGDGRRAMDKELGWFHACSAYPLSDLKIKIPIM